MLSTIPWFRLIKRTLAGVWIMLLTAACAVPSNQPATGVTFTAPIQVDVFSPNGTLQVLIWNAGQMDAQDQQGDCIISHDMQSGTDTVFCPEGVQYQEITPEKFAFPIQAIDQRIQITSQTVKVGERYRIALRGLSSDDCNSASATFEGRATSSTIALEEPDWLITEMACVQP
jgi:hypothetical protein